MKKTLFSVCFLLASTGLGGCQDHPVVSASSCPDDQYGCAGYPTTTVVEQSQPPRATFTVSPDTSENAGAVPVYLWGSTPTPTALGGQCQLIFTDAIYGYERGLADAFVEPTGDIWFESGTVWLSIPDDQLAIAVHVELSCPSGYDPDTGENVWYSDDADIVLHRGDVLDLTLDSFAQY